MKPYVILPIVASACLAGTAFHAHNINGQKGAIADSQLIAEATKEEGKEQLELDRVHYLEAVAKEVNAAKIAEVVFNKDGNLIRLDKNGNSIRLQIPSEILADQYFKLEQEIPTSLTLSSVGIRNVKTGEYAAIGILHKRRQIVFVYSLSEVQSKVNQIGEQK